MKYKILVAEDDQDIAEFIKLYLENEGYEVIHALDGLLAYEETKKQKIDLAVVDIMLPKMNGYDLIKKIREDSNIPIVILSAKNLDSDKILGLDLGADDYLTKPFGLAELTARVNSLVRRYTKFNPHHEENQRLRFHDMIIDPSAHSVEVQGKPVSLTAREFDILLFPAQHKGRIFTKQQIYQNIWKEPYYQDDGNIMSIISKLRKKIEPDPEHPFYVLTVYGVGYRFNEKA